MKMAIKDWDAGLTARDKRNLRRLKLFAAPWAVTFVLARVFLPHGDGTLQAQPLWGWVLIGVAIALSIGLALAYLRFIRGTDELMRRIHLDALAAGCGVAFVFGMAAGLLAQMGVPKVSELTWGVMLLAYLSRLGLASKSYE